MSRPLSCSSRTSSSTGIVPRCRDEQLHVEPALDLSRASRPFRRPGNALLRRLAGRARGEPLRASPAGRLRRARQAPRAGRRDRAGDAAQLRREQALVVPAAEALSSLRAVRGLLASALAALAVAALAPTAFASSGTTSSGPVYDGKGHLIQTPLVPPQPRAQLTQKQALETVERYPKVASWLSRYPQSGRSHSATYDRKTNEWTVKI